MKRQRWTGALAGGFQAEPDFTPRPAAPREIPLECDLVGLLLAEDARSKPRELWLGLALAAAAAALLASGAGIPMLAIAFTAAPLIGIGMEVFGPREPRQA